MTHRMIVSDAKELAGRFYDLDRTETFRASWPSQDEYVNVKWPHFVQAVRAQYAEYLGRPDVSEADKEAMHEALISDAPGASSGDASSPVPIFPGTQAFTGDRYDQRKINAIFGRSAQSMQARLRSTSALFPNLR